MTFINCISIGVTIAIIISGVSLLIYYRKKLDNLDGVVGIIVKHDEEEDNDNEKDKLD